MGNSNKWRPVFGYEGFYEVSDNGKVRSLDRTSNGRSLQGRILKPWTHQSGHRIIGLSKDGVCRKVYVHIIMLEAFVGLSKDGQESRHLDDNPSNNTIDNLCWGTRSENVKDRSRNGIHGSVKLRKKVLRSDGVVFESATKAAESVNGIKSNVSAVCIGKRKSHRGFDWSYV